MIDTLIEASLLYSFFGRHGAPKTERGLLEHSTREPQVTVRSLVEATLFNYSHVRSTFPRTLRVGCFITLLKEIEEVAKGTAHRVLGKT